MRLQSICRLNANFFQNQIMSFHSVFVYGTLKKGEPNHHWITSKENGCAKFISKGKTTKKYPLIIASKYNIPFLLQSPGNGENVIGEVYEVDDKMLTRLDILEDHPTFYEREVDEIELINDDNQQTDGKPEKIVKCWVYFLKKYKPALLTENFMTEYSSTGPHGKPYLERYLREPGYHVKAEVLVNADVKA